jgi:hypothetical protein
MFDIIAMVLKGFSVIRVRYLEVRRDNIKHNKAEVIFYLKSIF